MKTQSTLEKIQHCQSFKEKLNLLIKLCPSGYVLYLKNSEKYGITDLVQWIIDNTSKLNDPAYTWQTRVYWILHNINDFPKCVICGNQMFYCNVKSAQKGYADFLCLNKNCHRQIMANRQKKTMLHTHGYTNNFQNPDVIAKIKKHNIEKYGTACPANNKKIRAEIQLNNLEKYGTKYYSSTQECKEKVKATNIRKFGVDSPFKSDACMKKAKQTLLANYGVDHPLKSNKIIQQMKVNFIKKYGENYKQVVWGSCGNVGQNRRSYNDFILNSSKVEPLFSLDDFLKKRQLCEKDFKFRCKKCNNVFTSNWDNGLSKACPYCVNLGCSNEEQELYSFLLSFLPNTEIKHNDRLILNRLELDFYISNKNIAIEFDGLYWHNDDIQLNHRYHLNKTEQCEAKGIQLIHVFENEWIFKQDIVKSRLKNLLGFYDKTVFARKCLIEKINNDEANLFLFKNHIQGPVNAAVHYGLKYNGELLSLMSFGKSRFSIKYEWELLRFANILGYHIPGAASRLLKQFEREIKPHSLVSYADRRWSIGKMYKAIGFKLDHISAPDYWYFNSYADPILKSRMQFQKHKLKDFLKDFDEKKTEVENMKMNGFHRIFDCGNLVFVKEYYNEFKLSL